MVIRFRGEQIAAEHVITAASAAWVDGGEANSFSMQINALFAEVAIVRVEGYAVIDRELQVGFCSLANPMHDDRGQIVIPVNVGALAAQTSELQMAARLLELPKIGGST